MRKSRMLVTILLTMVLTWISIIPAQAQMTGDDREIVKAGYFAWDGYHMEDEDGIRSGYGFDFLKMAENYNNWAFTFVGYDKTWADMLDMLDSGEIDLVTSAQKTPEWEKKYDYSSASIGTSSTILTTRSDDDRYVVGDPSTYNGMTIGCITGSSRNKAFADLAGKNNFSYEAVYYEDLEELEDALHKEEVDGILSTNLRTMDGEKILEELNPTDYYVIVKKGNQELLDKVNKSIAEMDMNSPSWRTNLKDKYFTNNNKEEFVFNKEELDYIEQLRTDGTVFTVVTNPDLAPYSSFDENGRAIGIAPRIFEEIADQIGLKYEYQSFDTYEEYNEFIREGEADIDLTCFSDYGLAADHGIDLTNPYVKTTLAMLTKDTFNGELHTIAEMEAVGNNTIYTDELLDSVASRFYDTHEDCIQAVLDGKVDATYLYTYTAQKAVEEDAKNRLLYSIMPEYEIEMSVGVNESEDYRLISILNEGIRCLEGDFIQHVIQDEIAGIAEKDTVVSMIYDYPELALGRLSEN